MDALKDYAQVQLHEVRDGVQYYLISITKPLQPKINCIFFYFFFFFHFLSFLYLIVIHPINTNEII